MSHIAAQAAGDLRTAQIFLRPMHEGEANASCLLRHLFSRDADTVTVNSAIFRTFFGKNDLKYDK